MRHLLVSREYPPAPSGGIGTYVQQIARALVDAGDTVHVITQRWRGAEHLREVSHAGRLIVHRVPYTAPDGLFGVRPHQRLGATARSLFHSAMPAQAFAWEATGVAERLVAEEGIDVIETPEFEAPLYFFQRRRAQGLGPARTPPCIVHLHSPTEFIAESNGWPADHPLRLSSEHVERFSINAADALICPSRFLADQVVQRYGVDRAVTVLRCPIAAEEQLHRSARVWETGTILFIGRLERRKGALEWIDAAIQVARARPDTRFVFVGENRLDEHNPGYALVYSRIPVDLHSRFAFHGARDHNSVRALLAGARLVVVPSRWENFPYSCVEAMASGVPVMASPHGGMTEMIESGRSGWIAASSEPNDLAAATLEALDAGPRGLEETGRAAASAIGEMCDPATVVAQRRMLYGKLLRDDIDRRGRRGPHDDSPIDHGVRPAPAPHGRLADALRVMARHPATAVSVLAGRIRRRLLTRLGLS